MALCRLSESARRRRQGSCGNSYGHNPVRLMEAAPDNVFACAIALPVAHDDGVNHNPRRIISHSGEGDKSLLPRPEAWCFLRNDSRMR